LPGGKGGGGKALGAVLLLIAYSGVLAAELFMMDIEAER
jgi:MinD superfamily P-loop ATPase